jgi:hypothetical protein
MPRAAVLMESVVLGLGVVEALGDVRGDAGGVVAACPPSVPAARPVTAVAPADDVGLSPGAGVDDADVGGSVGATAADVPWPTSSR